MTTTRLKIRLRKWALDKAVEALEREKIAAPTLDQTISAAKRLEEFILGSTSK